MPERILIPIAKLQIDTQNPRLSKPSIGQREAQREIAQLQQARLAFQKPMLKRKKRGSE